MNTTLIRKAEKTFIEKNVPDVKVGDTVEVETIIREGNKQRIQKFRGLVIAVTGNGASKMITVRKISYGVGVEKKLPVYSPNVGKIRILKTEKTRRSKLYFMRDRVGKNSMRIRKGRTVMVPEEGQAPSAEEMSDVAPVESTEENAAE